MTTTLELNQALNNISQSELNIIQTQINKDTIQQDLINAEVELEKAKWLLENTKVYAPNDGFLTKSGSWFLRLVLVVFPLHVDK